MEKYNEQQAFEIELRKELDKFFPDNLIPVNFHFYGSRALQYQSLPSLKCGMETYEKICLFLDGDINEITFFEISFLINAIGSASPSQLIKPEDNAGMPSYVSIQKGITKLSHEWNDIVEPIKETVRRRVNAKVIRGINPISNSKIIH